MSTTYKIIAQPEPKRGGMLVVEVYFDGEYGWQEARDLQPNADAKALLDSLVPRWTETRAQAIAGSVDRALRESAQTKIEGYVSDLTEADLADIGLTPEEIAKIAEVKN